MKARAAAVAAVAALVTTSAAAAGGAAGAPPKPRCIRASDHATVRWLQTADHVRLRGAVLGRGTTGIVLAHMSRRDLCSWFPFARVLAGAGYRVLALDLRRHGASGWPSGIKANHQDRDVVAGAALLTRLGARGTILIGGSLGAAAVLTAAPRIPSVAGVVSMSGGTSTGPMDALAAVRRLHAPVLFVASDRDASYAQEAQTLYDAAASEDKRIVVFQSGEHGTNLLQGATASRARALLLEFVRTHAR